MKKFLIILVVFVLGVLGFTNSIIAELTVDGTITGVHAFQVGYDEYESALQGALANYESQGQSIDKYFGKESLPSEIQLGYSVLKVLLDRKVMAFFAMEQDVFPDEAQVQQITDELVSRYISDETTRAQLEMYYGSIENFRKVVEDIVFVRTLSQNVFNAIVPDYDASATEYFEKNKTDIKNEYESVNAAHILVSTEASAMELKEKILLGELSFEEAAKRYSLDQYSAQQGGNIGELKHGTVILEFEEAAFAATPGEIVGPVKTDYGYHLIKVNSKTTFDSYEDLKNSKAYEDIMSRFENEAFLGWITKYRQDKKIHYIIYEEDLKTFGELANLTDPGKFYNRIVNSLFDENNELKAGVPGIIAAFYIQMADDELKQYESREEAFKTIIGICERLPEEEKGVEHFSELKDKAAENENVKQLLDYAEILGVDSIENVHLRLEEIRNYMREIMNKAKKVAWYLYDKAPDSEKLLEYLYRFDSDNPKAVYLYTENFYKNQVQPVLADSDIFSSYINAYKQYLGENATETLLGYLIKGLEGRLVEKIVEDESVSEDLRKSALELLVDAYENACNLPLDNRLKLQYLGTERDYLLKLSELTPEATDVKQLLDAVDERLKELR
ncbi:MULTISPECIES: peptidylprolyl isomerase [Kosmotoga]|uniref:PpiC-type peptidyl-prolyl cis-trans isomerase n=1 Tax=Kosmotoga olearia (strain ATCC BAA-1733 / DSM 21960 / TBF 19.5.1) TaxID=521045 RepID=C5CFG3_KOSOT|nr:MULTISPECIES: peptidylprolyl isomerase [Kosmotoga]ACR80371.1 PpiC-type peptidyl-prolyl cis-trans isomerase [Kosmotoga olearia TBF 19.5.1]MDI3523804.1 peptidyl-prolyl cis-trans isomerase [Kosmotoga sp.]MDK2953348.1 peptidyl-prolyl cis-trans isomerase [Kosmotoga sp.]